MKKFNVLTIVALLFIGLSFSSCSKCVTCSEVSMMGVVVSAEMEVCEEDYADNDTYDAAIDAYEALGSTCN